MPEEIVVNDHRTSMWAFLLLFAFADLTACATRETPKRETAATVSPCSKEDGETRQTTPVLRAGRYALIDLRADAPQLDLMQQIVDITFPAPINITVGDAIRYLLLRTGYQLCDSPVVQPLDSLPLPAPHMHLGPLTLRQATEVLLGPAWTIEVDEATRHVCFGPSRTPSQPSGASSRVPAQPVSGS